MGKVTSGTKYVLVVQIIGYILIDKAVEVVRECRTHMSTKINLQDKDDMELDEVE